MPDSPRLTQAKKIERAARETRLAEALRDNLRRRKQQMRAREAQGDPQGQAQDALVASDRAASDRRNGKPDATG